MSAHQASSAAKTVEELGKAVTISSSGAKSSARLGFLMKLKDMVMRLFRYLTTAKNWKTNPGVWIGSLIFLRCFYQFLREYGLTLFKKDLSKDHVFLTGAGNGIGRLMAQKLAAMGCKLSISDINLEGVKETERMLVAAGAKASNILSMRLDVCSKESI